MYIVHSTKFDQREMWFKMHLMWGTHLSLWSSVRPKCWRKTEKKGLLSIKIWGKDLHCLRVKIMLEVAFCRVVTKNEDDNEDINLAYEVFKILNFYTNVR